jgi:hypothetical protein
MKYYKLTPEEKDTLMFEGTDDEIFPVINAVQLWKRGDTWSIPSLKLAYTESGKALGETDCIFHIGVAFSDQAVSKMKSFFTTNGDLLPIGVGNGPNFTAFVPTPHPELIDLDNSAYIDFGDGSAPIFEKYAFHNDVSKDVCVFRENEGSQRIIVNEDFKSQWAEHGLTGIVFKQL